MEDLQNQAINNSEHIQKNWYQNKVSSPQCKWSLKKKLSRTPVSKKSNCPVNFKELAYQIQQNWYLNTYSLKCLYQKRRKVEN